MTTNGRAFWKCAFAIVVAILPLHDFAHAQGPQPGRSIGAISTQGDLILMTLDEGVLGKANLFDLAHHTLRFTPEGSRFRAENLAFEWDSEFGTEITGSQATLKNFAFPFSGRTWR